MRSLIDNHWCDPDAVKADIVERSVTVEPDKKPESSVPQFKSKNRALPHQKTRSRTHIHNTYTNAHTRCWCLETQMNEHVWIFANTVNSPKAKALLRGWACEWHKNVCAWTQTWRTWYYIGHETSSTTLHEIKVSTRNKLFCVTVKLSSASSFLGRRYGAIVPQRVHVYYVQVSLFCFSLLRFVCLFVFFQLHCIWVILEK